MVAGDETGGPRAYARGDAARILISEQEPHLAPATPPFWWVRYHAGLIVYEEALIDGQFFGVNWSAMGRPSSRERIWGSFGSTPGGGRPDRARQHAFLLEIDGQRLTDRWQWIDARSEEGADGLHCTVRLQHSVRPVQVAVHTTLDGTAVLARRLEIVNTGERPAAVGTVFPWSGMLWAVDLGFAMRPSEVAAPFSVGRFQITGQLFEGQFAWEGVPDGGLHIENVQGVSGHGAPFCLLRNEVTGEGAIMHLEYSGNWQLEIYSDNEPVIWPTAGARLYARLGLAGGAPIRVLQPGERVATPAAHIGQFRGDLDAGVQLMHRHQRRAVLPAQPAERAHPVECNHTGYTLNAQITEAQLCEEVDLAADVGVELFMVDAGWFGDAGGNWAALVGDWQESPLLPRGLAPVFERIRGHGMRCGLWAEVERVGPGSKARAAHPEWLMRRRGEVIEQLDLAQPAVARHVEETIVRLVDRYRLDCFRLDYNIKVGEGGQSERDGFVESTMWRYYDALYGIFDRIRARFPSLLLENCASGGGRMDLGMMRRFHWTQFSDNWSPEATLKILNGVTLALPPEACMTLLGAISRGTADLDFMLRVGMFGHFCISGIFPTMGERQPVARERWRHAVDLYKTVARPLLPTCRVFHHTPVQRHTEPGDWCVLEYAAPDGAGAYAGVFRLPGAATDSYHLRPRGLDVSRRYRVSLDNHRAHFEAAGIDLLNQGLWLRVPGALQSELVLFEAL